MKIKHVHKVSPEALELSDEIILIQNIWLTRRVPSLDRLINPNEIGELVPSVRILRRPIRSRFPEDRSVFLQQAQHRRTTWSSGEPHCYLVGGRGIL